jgi:hypothetical protein
VKQQNSLKIGLVFGISLLSGIAVLGLTQKSHLPFASPEMKDANALSRSENPAPKTWVHLLKPKCQCSGEVRRQLYESAER